LVADGAQVTCEAGLTDWPFEGGRIAVLAPGPLSQGSILIWRTPVAEDNHSIRVEIYDESYNLRGSDPAYIQRLAELVDAKMRAVAQHTSTVDSLRVAVLSALNIADDYYQLRRKYDVLESEYASRANNLGHALDSALDEALSDTRRTG
jgi:cell division protein ZapA